MKKAKNNLDLPATKRELGGVEEKLGGVEKKLGAKIDRVEGKLRAEMGRMETGLRAEMEVVAEKWANKTDEKARQYRDQILSVIDPIAKEISDTREERAVTAYQREQDREVIDDHEERIGVLEQKVTVFPS